MKKILSNIYGSINPLITALLAIVVFGFLYGVFNYVLSPLMNMDDQMNLLMSRIWWGLVLIAFIVIVAWLFLQAQRQKTRGLY